MMNEKILSVEKLFTQFKTENSPITVVRGVSFDIYKGRTLGIVGESGSGKSVTALSIMRLIPKSIGNIVGGSIWMQGQDILQLPNRDMRSIRGGKIAMIFQDPMTALNPVFTIGYQIKEVLSLHQGLNSKDARDQSIELLKLVGVPAPEKRIHEYPGELSGGMQQRAIIAMALAGKPSVLIADEPTTALDATIKNQVIELLSRLQEEFGMGIMLITHDLAIVTEICHEVAVMYAGKIVEQASMQDLFNHPRHPYTHGLIASIPSLSPIKAKKQQKLLTIPGNVPALDSLPPGCSFQDRCYRVQQDCKGSRGTPLLEEKSLNQRARCFHPL